MTTPRHRALVERAFGHGGLPEGAWEMLEESLSPRSPAMLLDLAAEVGTREGALVLDAGCRDGMHARALSERFGCRVIGVDLVLAGGGDDGRSEAGEGVALVRGDIESLPLPGDAVDVVWCRDTLECLEDVSGALVELARVLRPGGGVLLHGICATDKLEPVERARLYSALGIVPASVDRAWIETSIAEANLTVVHRECVSPEWAERDLEKGGAVLVRSMLSIARMRRGRDRLVGRLGPEWYERILAWEQWVPYLLLGKLEAMVWLLRKPSQ